MINKEFIRLTDNRSFPFKIDLIRKIMQVLHLFSEVETEKMGD